MISQVWFWFPSSYVSHQFFLPFKCSLKCMACFVSPTAWRSQGWWHHLLSKVRGLLALSPVRLVSLYGGLPLQKWHPDDLPWDTHCPRLLSVSTWACYVLPPCWRLCVEFVVPFLSVNWSINWKLPSMTSQSPWILGSRWCSTRGWITWRWAWNYWQCKLIAGGACWVVNGQPLTVQCGQTFFVW